MIDERDQELATDYVLGELDGPATADFETALHARPELKAWVREHQDAWGALALSPTPVQPPSGLLSRVILQVSPRSKIVPFAFLPWSLAAALAVACVFLAFSQYRTRQELAAWQSKDALSQVRIATLTAQAAEYAQTVAVVLWDAERQRGILKLASLPPPAAGKDYQLWVLDPTQPKPVSAGVIKVSAAGAARAEFEPVQRIQRGEKFAVSVERTGGSPAPEGQIILIGNQ